MYIYIILLKFYGTLNPVAFAVLPPHIGPTVPADNIAKT